MASRGHARSSHQANWREGDIAFLKPAASFSPRDHDELIGSGYLPERATTHPVIVLAVQNHRAIVTTVSAYSTEVNRFLPPWQQVFHRAKNPDHFRAFEGSRRPNQRHPALRLADPRMRMPKPQASWVFVEAFFCVPFSVLGHFNKAPVLLRVHPESLAQLKGDMRRFARQYQDAGERLRAGGPAVSVSVSASVAPAAADPDRRRPGPPPPAPVGPRPPAQVRSSGSAALGQSSTSGPARALASLTSKSWSSVATGSCAPAAAKRPVRAH